MSEWDAFPIAGKAATLDQGGWDAFPQAPPIGVNDVVRSVATGIPVLGGLANKGNAAINATLAPALNPLFDEKNQLKGENWSDRYAASLGQQNQQDQAFSQAHPVADTAAQIAGGVGSLVATGGTAAGARMLGMTGTLPQMVGRGALSGAGLNVADAAVRGHDVTMPAVIGGAVGAGAPLVGRAVSAAANPLINTVRGLMNPAGEAARRVGTAVNRDLVSGSGGLSPQEFVSARDAGMPVNLMDVGGETTRSLARSAANTSPEGRDVLNRSINNRFETQGDRTTNWLNSTFHFPDAAGQQAALETTARSANKANYTKAMQEGADGLWSPELERLAGSDAVSGAMQAAAKAAKDESIVSGYGAMNPKITFTQDGRIQFTKGPSGVPTYPDLQFWDLTRRELSDAAQRAGPGTSEARRLKSFATSLNGELDKMVPSYQAARSGAAQAFGAQDALEAGQKFVTSKMANDEARLAIAKMSPTEKKLFQDGYASTLIQKIRETPDRRAITNRIGNSAAEQERLNMALGPDRAKQFRAMLHVEGIMDLARPAVQGNSTTARQLAELGLAGGAYTAGSGGNVLNPDPTAIMSAALVYGAARGRNVIDTRVARQVAQMLTSNDPVLLAQGMKLLTKTPRLFKSIQNTDAALASMAARGAEPALTNRAGPSRH